LSPKGAGATKLMSGLRELCLGHVIGETRYLVLERSRQGIRLRIAVGYPERVQDAGAPPRFDAGRRLDGEALVSHHRAVESRALPLAEDQREELQRWGVGIGVPRDPVGD